MQRILGQPNAIEALTGALRSGRVHHAWIFAGPKGVGKFTTAVVFAKQLLDPQFDPSGETNSQLDLQTETSRLIDAGTHPDLHIIQKELALFSDNPDLRTKKLMNIPLDLLRERVIGGQTSDGRTHEAPAYRTPTLGHGKVFIIDEFTGRISEDKRYANGLHQAIEAKESVEVNSEDQTLAKIT